MLALIFVRMQKFCPVAISYDCGPMWLAKKLCRKAQDLVSEVTLLQSTTPAFTPWSARLLIPV